MAYAKANSSMSVPAVSRAHGVPEKAAAAEEKKHARAATLEAKAAEVAAAEAAKAAKAAAEFAAVMELERKKKHRRPSTAEGALVGPEYNKLYMKGGTRTPGEVTGCMHYVCPPA
jgi:hypothetical protein